MAIEKTRSATLEKRETKSYKKMVNGGRTAFVTAPLLPLLEGGVPIVFQGKIIGAIEMSGLKPELEVQLA